VLHRQFAFDHHVADPPAPPGQTVGERERLQVAVPLRRHGAGGPLMGEQRHLGPGRQRERQVQRDEPGPPVAGHRVGHREQPVVAPGPQPADRAGGVSADTVRDEPLVVGAAPIG
jgi:hypothetical protein